MCQMPRDPRALQIDAGLGADWRRPVDRSAALRASREVGSFGVLTHPIDGQVRQFYRRWGFEDVPFDPKRSMVVRMVDIEKSGVVA